MSVQNLQMLCVNSYYNIHKHGSPINTSSNADATSYNINIYSIKLVALECLKLVALVALESLICVNFREKNPIET